MLLNLLGDTALEAIPATPALLQGAMAVPVLWHERAAAPIAARAGLAWLSSVFVDNARLDPVEALYQYARQQAVAWTRYARWQTVVPHRVSMPELVKLLLDRRSQRAEMAQAKSDFYTFQTRRIYQAVAFGRKGAWVNDFPGMVRQHLRNDRRPQEVFRIRTISLPGRRSTAQDIDDLVRQHYNLGPRQPVLPAWLDGDPSSSTDFWFVIVGWHCTSPLRDAQHGAAPIEAIATWCRTHLLPELRQETQHANVRVLSVVAMEVPSKEMVEALEDSMAALIEDLNDDASFHLGQLDQLGTVERQDLRNYFQDPQICSCPDPYRREFPGLLLAGRRDMPFEQAVAAIQRGEPDNWGNFYEELQEMTARGEWPPDDDADDTFGESRDGR